MLLRVVGWGLIAYPVFGLLAAYEIIERLPQWTYMATAPVWILGFGYGFAGESGPVFYVTMFGPAVIMIGCGLYLLRLIK